MKRNKQDLQNTAQKTNDEAARITLTSEEYSSRVSSSYSTSAIRRVSLATNPVVNHK